MRCLILSDLHLEHDCDWIIPKVLPDFDVAIFAGDIDLTPKEAVLRLANEPGLVGKPVVYVPGNHEFYGGEINARLAEGRSAAGGTRVFMLEPANVVSIDGVPFVGATLWSDFKIYGDAVAAMALCQMTLDAEAPIFIEDHGKGARRVKPSDLQHLHARDLSAIEESLAAVGPGAMVVTHFAPHPNSIHPRYEASSITGGFVSDLTDTILRHAPALWIHGHTHESFDYFVGATRIICNPKGYGPNDGEWRSENPAFVEDLVIEI